MPVAYSQERPEGVHATPLGTSAIVAGQVPPSGCDELQVHPSQGRPSLAIGFAAVALVNPAIATVGREAKMRIRR